MTPTKFHEDSKFYFFGNYFWIISSGNHGSDFFVKNDFEKYNIFYLHISESKSKSIKNKNYVTSQFDPYKNTLNPKFKSCYCE